jgi:hypothetical protein
LVELTETGLRTLNPLEAGATIHAENGFICAAAAATRTVFGCNDTHALAIHGFTLYSKPIERTIIQMPSIGDWKSDVFANVKSKPVFLGV